MEGSRERKVREGEGGGVESWGCKVEGRKSGGVEGGVESGVDVEAWKGVGGCAAGVLNRTARNRTERRDTEVNPGKPRPDRTEPQHPRYMLLEYLIAVHDMAWLLLEYGR